MGDPAQHGASERDLGNGLRDVEAMFKLAQRCARADGQWRGQDQRA